MISESLENIWTHGFLRFTGFISVTKGIIYSFHYSWTLTENSFTFTPYPENIEAIIPVLRTLTIRAKSRFELTNEFSSAEVKGLKEQHGMSIIAIRSGIF